MQEVNLSKGVSLLILMVQYSFCGLSHPMKHVKRSEHTFTQGSCQPTVEHKTRYNYPKISPFVAPRSPHIDLQTH